MPRYSKQQIEEMVRVERLALRQELIPLDRQLAHLRRRRRWIINRLETLENSEGLIEGMDRQLVV